MQGAKLLDAVGELGLEIAPRGSLTTRPGLRQTPSVLCC